MRAFFFAEGLTDFFEFFGAVLGFFPDALTDKDGSFGLDGEDEAVAGARIDFDDLGVNFIVRFEDDPGKIGVAAQIVDDDAFDFDVEGVENIADKFMGERAFVVLAAHGHGDGASDDGFDVDNETFFVVANEDGQGVLVGGKDTEDFHPNDIRVHTLRVALRSPNDNGGRISNVNLISRNLHRRPAVDGYQIFLPESA